MGLLLKHTARTWAAISGVAWLTLAVVPPAPAQIFHRGNPSPGCSSPAPCEPPLAERPSERPSETPRPPDETRPTTPEAPPATEGFRPPAGPGEMVSRMMGNQLGIPVLAFTSLQRRGINSEAVLIPSVRGFRISEDESPRPEDRVYLGFNYFDRVGEAVNRRLFAPLSNLRVYRETFGVEKTCLDGAASVGLRLPLNTLTANSEIAGLNGSNTDIGDLTVILKAALWQDADTGSLLSGGVAVTAPTGPNGFAGSRLTTFHNTILQPYMGYICNAGNFFIQGFTAVDVPTDANDVTYLFNDIGVGYHIHHGASDAFITDIIPTVEVHFSDPLNHRGALTFTDPAGSSDLVDITTGVTLEFKRNCTLALGVVTPLTGPRPFDFEVLAQLNIRFGARGTGGGPSPGGLLGN